jgi:acyl dehydratase
MSTVVNGVDELLALAGEELGVTGWVVVDQAAVSAFAAVTRDEQWIHVDAGRAADGAFGTTIAHGFFTLSLCSHFFGELLTVLDAGMVINYGLDRVRFPGPVPIGSRVRARGTLIGAEARPDGAVQTVTRLTIEREDATKPVCVADQVSRFHRR